ncbi:MAG: DUF305 domain-containing protein [Caldilineaceae bacterium]
MKIRFIVFVAMLVTLLALAACGGSQSSNTEAPATAPAAATDTATTVAANAAPAEAATVAATEAATVEATPTHDMTAMAPGEVMTGTGDMTATGDMSGMAGMGDMGGMNMSPDTAFDIRFIDSMIPHHQGAVAMAQQALQQAEHPEIKQMAQQIIDAQNAEMKQMQDWRGAWYPNAGATEGMQMDMGNGMNMMEVPAGDQPFDLRFIDAMIPHHQDAIMMAQEAQAKSEHPEVKQMAQQIIAAQQAEIKQLQEWRMAWYPNQ